MSNRISDNVIAPYQVKGNGAQDSRDEFDEKKHWGINASLKNRRMFYESILANDFETAFSMVDLITNNAIQFVERLEESERIYQLQNSLIDGLEKKIVNRDGPPN